MLEALLPLAGKVSIPELERFFKRDDGPFSYFDAFFIVKSFSSLAIVIVDLQCTSVDEAMAHGKSIWKWHCTTTRVSPEARDLLMSINYQATVEQLVEQIKILNHELGGNGRDCTIEVSQVLALYGYSLTDEGRQGKLPDEMEGALEILIEDTREFIHTVKNIGVPCDEKDGDCPICQETPTAPVKTRKCGHVFCQDCLEFWWCTNTERDIITCPMCRADIEDV